MPDDAALAAQRARSASAEEIKVLVHDGNEATLLALLEDPNFDEPDVVHLLERLDLSSKLLSAVADAGKWTSSEAVRLRLARTSPHSQTHYARSSPPAVSFRFGERLSLQPSAPADVRRAAEAIILIRIPHMPVGEKLTWRGAVRHELQEPFWRKDIRRQSSWPSATDFSPKARY